MRTLRSATTLLTFAAQAAMKDPHGLALNIARKIPARARRAVTATARKVPNPAVQAAGLLLADERQAAAALLAASDGGAFRHLRDWVAVGSHAQVPVRGAAARRRQDFALGELDVDSAAGSADAAGTRRAGRASNWAGMPQWPWLRHVLRPVSAWRADEARVLRGEWRPDEAPDAVARRRLARSQEAAGPGPRPVLVLTNSYPHSTAGYAQRTHTLLQAITRQLCEGTKGQTSDGAGTKGETPDGAGARQACRECLRAVTRYGYPAIIGVLSAGPDQVDDVTYHRHIPGLFHPLLSRRLAAHTDHVVEHVIACGATVIHATTDYENGLVARAAARRLGLPWVYEMRGERERSWVASLPQAWRERAAASPRFRALRAREAELANDADRVIVLSEVQRAALAARGVTTPILVVGNGVPQASLEKPLDRAAARAEVCAEWGLETDTPLIGTITAVVDYEGLDLLVDVAQLLATRLPAARILIVGDGVALPELKARAAAQGVDTMIFVGKVPPERAAVYYAALDVFTVPRADTDVTRTITPLKSIPALGVGCPVLVSDVPALEEITPPEAAEWILPRDPEIWAQAIVDCVGQLDDTRTHPLAPAARAFAASRTWERGAARIVRAYEELGEKPSAAMSAAPAEDPRGEER
ncbi:hypothetical protein C1Y63_11365 [Corynebacterium sp. 13CS0277]|uniref:glycosyltransferase family 4 protein n=1 Tax=Corynebacterium sp. 13CS0277 TaxID=2071994 RepID=UPI000D0471BA|nr:glycosyltransferase family 4 protein [Corynebacterium sp. 13CS0277]PRQ10479.1 hypothetical protein C1Y63_11365 [Corynebacterium sp. 13CS0277]